MKSENQNESEECFTKDYSEFFKDIDSSMNIDSIPRDIDSTPLDIEVNPLIDIARWIATPLSDCDDA